MRSLLYVLSAVLFGALVGTATAGHCAHVNGFGYSRGFSSPLVLNQSYYQPAPVALVPSVGLGNYGGVATCNGSVALAAPSYGYSAPPVLLAAPSYGYGNVAFARSGFSGGYGYNDVAIVHDHNDAVVNQGGGLVGDVIGAARNIVRDVLGGGRSVEVQSGNTRVRVGGRRGR